MSHAVISLTCIFRAEGAVNEILVTIPFSIPQNLSKDNRRSASAYPSTKPDLAHSIAIYQ